MSTRVDSSTGPATDTRALRDVLGHFCSGVTVVTAMVGDEPAGFTCQSFSALSLDPPQVLLCPSRRSTSWPAIRTVETFCVNVLSSGQHALSDRFAKSGGRKFDGVRWRPAEGGAPIIGGVAAWFEVALAAEHDGGDHLIAVADLLGFGSDPTTQPLVFHRSRYGGVVELSLGSIERGT
ncbi:MULTISPECIES: flavin reductase family protein [Rhodococcus]|uniref:flavin reductase family protein n=1 Tax=Rhodococcus TaxID=1827 RepID=UPI001387005E|nr:MULTISPECIES: flavin reductase family protein [Rhodococcus]NCL77303.1 Flavin-dependent monooxygenase, reductase subunit HsaB [Rhodococcus sp. YH1]MBC2591548.1 flavin reductase family protein [Rhodococcus aetherivorans]QIX49210.1 flavin reductase family protein [Rhodococcus sp. DMU1]QRI75758.1 flavin reductase family protein [Rhodococcus aetherivorans]QSE59168.1 flavin reductase family protein [Rhodococcus sp. PSBB066]